MAQAVEALTLSLQKPPLGIRGTAEGCLWWRRRSLFPMNFGCAALQQLREQRFAEAAEAIAAVQEAEVNDGACA